MKTFWNTQGGLTQLPEWQPNCWIQVTCPTEEDQHELEEKFNIPDYLSTWITLIQFHSYMEQETHLTTLIIVLGIVNHAQWILTL